MNEDCTILVTSCDAYRDVERPFLALFRKYWRDCPFELVVVGETGAEAGFDRAILTGCGKSWSAMLVEALKAISTPYVMLLMNDYLLNGEVDTQLILTRLAEAKRANALNYRLCPEPPYAIKNKAYAISCKAGIWNREFLISIASRTNSAWEFERHGSYMFDPADTRPLLVSDKLEFPFVDAIRKGYWERGSLAWLRREGIEVDLSRRTASPLGVRMVEGLKAFAYRLLPVNGIVRAQNKLETLHRKLGDLWWYSILLFIAQRIGDVINFFIGVWIVPRYVPMKELGAVLPLMNIVSAISIPIAIVSIPFLKFIAVFAEKGELGKAKALIRDTFVATAIFSAFSILVAWLLLPRFFVTLRIEDGSLALLLVMVAVATSVQGLFINAASGLKLFSATVWFNVLAAPIRLITMLIFMPFRALSGYMVGQGAGPAVGIVGSLIVLRRFFSSAIKPLGYWREYAREIWRYTWPLAIMAVVTTLTTNLDSIVIRSRLSEFDSAGYYMITRFSDIALYLGAAFSSFLLPMLAGRNGDDREARHLTLHSCLASAGGGLVVVLALWLFGGALMNANREWMKYAALSGYLPLFALNSTLLMVASCITMAFIARGRFAFLIYALPLMLSKSVSLYLIPNCTLSDVAWLFLLAQGLSVALLCLHAFHPRSPGMSDGRIAVIVHLYYPELVDGLMKRVRMILAVAPRSRIIVTAPNAELLERWTLPGEKRVVENRGYDLGPFFAAIDSLDLDEFDYVVKLHTKRNRFGIVNCMPLFGGEWRRKLLGFVNSRRRFATTLQRFERDPNLGMIGHGSLILDYANDHSGIVWTEVEKALASVGLGHPELKRSSFVAGTMFIVRAKLLKPFWRKVGEGAFSEMRGREGDDSPAHVYERAVSLAVEAQGMRIGGYPSNIFFKPSRAIISHIYYNWFHRSR